MSNGNDPDYLKTIAEELTAIRSSLTPALETIGRELAAVHTSFTPQLTTIGNGLPSLKTELVAAIASMTAELEAVRKALTPKESKFNEKVQSTLDLVTGLRGSLSDDIGPADAPTPPALTASWGGGEISAVKLNGTDAGNRWVSAAQLSGKSTKVKLALGAAALKGLDVDQPLELLVLQDEEDGDPVAVAGPIEVTTIP